MQVYGTFQGFTLSTSFRLVEKNRPLNYIETTTLTLSRRFFQNNIPIKHQTSGGMTGCLEMAFFQTWLSGFDLRMVTCNKIAMFE